MSVQTRNHTRLTDGGIDCEINHPEFGWIPFTATSNDTEPFGQDIWAAVHTRGDIAPYVPAVPTTDDINAARAHRLTQGVIVSVTGYAAPIPVQCTDADCHNLRGLHQIAKNRVAAGDVTTIAAFRCAANAMHDLTPPQMEELCRKTFAYRDDLLAASWALKDTDPIPTDYATNDAHWPPNRL